MFDGRWHRGRRVQRLMLCIRAKGAGLLEVWDRARASVRAKACAVHQSKYRMLIYCRNTFHITVLAPKATLGHWFSSAHVVARTLCPEPSSGPKPFAIAL